MLKRTRATSPKLGGLDKDQDLLIFRKFGRCSIKHFLPFIIRTNFRMSSKSLVYLDCKARIRRNKFHFDSSTLIPKNFRLFVSSCCISRGESLPVEVLLRRWNGTK